MKLSKFLIKEEALKANRAVMETKSNYDPELWQKIVQLGWTGIRIPEEFGGLGLGHLGFVLLLKNLAPPAPVPFSSSVYLFTEALLEFASEEQKTQILPQLVSGEVVGTFAMAETAAAPTEQNLAG